MSTAYPSVKSTLRCPCCGTVLPPDSLIPLPSEDFRSLVWILGGKEVQFSFTPQQAAVIRILWQAWEAHTPDVGICYIRERIGADNVANPSVGNLFPRKHKALWTLIVKGSTKGTIRLIDPN